MNSFSPVPKNLKRTLCNKNESTFKELPLNKGLDRGMLVISLIVAGILFLWWGYFLQRSLGIPGPPIIPFLGSFPYLFFQKRHQSLRWYEECVRKYGPIFHIVGLFGTKRAIVVSDPKLVKHFLMTNSKNYERRPVVKRFDQLFGQGIFNSRGKTWKDQRKIARPFFRKASLGDHIPVIQNYAENFTDALSEDLERPVDIQEAFYRLTLRIICDIGFGVKLAPTVIDSFNENFNQAQWIVERNIRNPLLEFRGDPNFDKNLEMLDTFVDLVLRDRNSGSSNLLDLFEETHGESREYMRDTLLNFIIAGRDTTATLLAWTLFCLALNPTVEARLREELQSVPLTQTGIQQCKYLRWVFDEVLRLYPPIPVDTRSAIEDDVLPTVPTARVPKGTFLVYSAWIMGRHPKYWENPLQFRPERWGEKGVPKDRYTFVPFHAGPQTCMGMNLAYLEASIILIEILSKFRFQLDETHPVAPRKFIVLTAKGGMWLNFYRVDKGSVVHENHGDIEERKED